MLAGDLGFFLICLKVPVHVGHPSRVCPDFLWLHQVRALLAFKQLPPTLADQAFQPTTPSGVTISIKG